MSERNLIMSLRKNPTHSIMRQGNVGRYMLALLDTTLFTQSILFIINIINTFTPISRKSVINNELNG